MKADINNFRQNHPELIVSDLSAFVDGDVVRQVLKFRGINKWLRVRRLLIQLKSRWREQVKELELQKRDLSGKDRHKMQGYIEAMTDCRQQIRALCHSQRDIDFPTNKHDFGASCQLPTNFPKRPHKRWLLTH